MPEREIKNCPTPALCALAGHSYRAWSGEILSVRRRFWGLGMRGYTTECVPTIWHRKRSGHRSVFLFCHDISVN